MGRRKQNGKVDNWLKKGRGSGEGEHYVPFVQVQNVPSRGVSTRTSHSEYPRVAHQLSNLETHLRFMIEWSNDTVEDIREQYPLPLDETLEIAEELGIKHPVDPKTKENWPLTTDFLVNFRNESTMAITVKPSNNIKIRDVEKFEIEMAYWKLHGAEWGIVTDRELLPTVVENLKYVRKAYDLRDYEISEAQVKRIRSATESLLNGGHTMTDLANQTDDLLGLEVGTCLTVFRHLIARKLWIVDMTQALEPDKPLRVIRVIKTPLFGDKECLA